MTSFSNRVQETTTTTGTGAISMGGAATGFQAFSAAFSTGNVVHYSIVGRGTGEWEVGTGTLTTGTPWTLTRNTVESSSNGNALVTFSAGTKDVFATVLGSELNKIQTAVQQSRQVTAGDGLTGGGDFSADRTIKLNAAPATIASAGTTDLSTTTSLVVTVSGTTTITSFGAGTNLFRIVKFSGALTLTHNATSLILPSGANITTAAGDSLIAASDGSGNWTVLNYMRAAAGSLDPLVAGTAANNVLKLDGSAKIPAVDGSQLTNLAAGGWTLIGTLTTTSGATQSITGISSTYKMLIAVVRGVSGSGSQQFQVALSSNNGSSYSTAVAISAESLGAAVLIDGAVYIDNTGTTGVAKVVRPATCDSAGANTFSTVAYVSGVTGVINAVQFSVNFNAFDAGAIDLYGIK
jgi:hypothetical protein